MTLLIYVLYITFNPSRSFFEERWSKTLFERSNEWKYSTWYLKKTMFMMKNAKNETKRKVGWFIKTFPLSIFKGKKYIEENISFDNKY